MLKSIMHNCALAAALTVMFVGCSADSNDAAQKNLSLPASETLPDSAETQASETLDPGTMVVHAGPAAAELGLARWELGDDGIYGLDSNGQARAEFHILIDDKAVESALPERGLMAIDGSTAFPALTQQYYDAMTLDLSVSSADSAGAGAGVQPSARECFFFMANCTRRVNEFDALGFICSCRLFDPSCPLFLPIGFNCFND